MITKSEKNGVDVESRFETNPTKKIKMPNRTSIPLQEIVHRIAASSLSAAARKHSFIVNDIPTDLSVDTDENLLASVVATLLYTVIDHTEYSCIRVSAKTFGEIILVNVKEVHRAGGHAFDGNLRGIQKLAERIGGAVSVSNNREKSTDILFSFANHIHAAA